MQTPNLSPEISVPENLYSNSKNVKGRVLSDFEKKRKNVRIYIYIYIYIYSYTGHIDTALYTQLPTPIDN